MEGDTWKGHPWITEFTPLQRLPCYIIIPGNNLFDPYRSNFKVRIKFLNSIFSRHLFDLENRNRKCKGFRNIEEKLQWESMPFFSAA